MVRPNVNGSSAVKKESKKVDLVQEFATNKAFQTKVLQETANRWASASGFNGDLTFNRIADTGKSVILNIDGKEYGTKFVLCGKYSNAKLISGKAIYRASYK